MKLSEDIVNVGQTVMKKQTNRTTLSLIRRSIKSVGRIIFNPLSTFVRSITDATSTNRCHDRQTKLYLIFSSPTYKPEKKGNRNMSRLNMTVTTVVTDEQGNKTVEDVLSLGSMKLIDVVKMQIKLVDAVKARLEEQKAELQGQGQA